MLGIAASLISIIIGLAAWVLISIIFGLAAIAGGVGLATQAGTALLLFFCGDIHFRRDGLSLVKEFYGSKSPQNSRARQPCAGTFPAVV